MVPHARVQIARLPGDRGEALRVRLATALEHRPPVAVVGLAKQERAQMSILSASEIA
jgi:hypothetical protein